MAVKWTCPKCRAKMFSAWERKDHPHVTCTECGERFDNPYYKKVV